MIKNYDYELIDMMDTGFTHLGFNSLDFAEKHGQAVWDCLSANDRKKRNDFMLIKCMNPETTSSDHLDGIIIKRWK